jgi:uncharacterized membrane protein
MPAQLFSKDEQLRIVEAIQQAELNTSGEIRVHIDRKCPEDVLDRATYWFEKLEMHKTAARNGVLLYLAADDHKFAILGDAGINHTVPEGFWNDIRNLMQEYFREGRFAEGLIKGILASGEQLKAHFPYQSDDVNEISNEISFGEPS